MRATFAQPARGFAAATGAGVRLPFGAAPAGSSGATPSASSSSRFFSASGAPHNAPFGGPLPSFGAAAGAGVGAGAGINPSAMGTALAPSVPTSEAALKPRLRAGRGIVEASWSCMLDEDC
ncbi:hypothetical protein CXG81DRAFT_25206 [Caulochytrium protostelioides]|uniref:Uncharacterized protein n=1 Tax=Caulochytrium protostelioides TaxID=1555241 RepID=A0A4P9X9V7_9FUNG|nr:hypothetical protein CXG81DRAFT_25206 [Caulochytrium protostelioides]|eukprot:RKP02118.1 hypothetical protein CXG81DRAFT_25206 [Caulochytrium protostelioides]